MGTVCMTLGTLAVFANETTHLCTKRLCFWSTGDLARFLECLCKPAHSSLSTSTLRFTTFDNALFSAPQQAYARRVFHLYEAWRATRCDRSFTVRAHDTCRRIDVCVISWRPDAGVLHVGGYEQSRTSTGSEQGRSVSSRFQGKKCRRKSRCTIIAFVYPARPALPQWSCLLLCMHVDCTLHRYSPYGAIWMAT